MVGHIPGLASEAEHDRVQQYRISQHGVPAEHPSVPSNDRLHEDECPVKHISRHGGSNGLDLRLLLLWHYRSTGHHRHLRVLCSRPERLPWSDRYWQREDAVYLASTAADCHALVSWSRH